MASMTSDDDCAADTIPVALVAAALVMAVITGLAAFGLNNALPAAQLASVDRQSDEMANDCRFLLSMASRNLDDPRSPPGALKTFEFDLPDSTEYLSFGYDPDSEGGHHGTIYYSVSGTKKAIVVDESAAFLPADGGHMILRRGSHSISIEHARDALGHRYLLLSSPG